MMHLSELVSKRQSINRHTRIHQKSGFLFLIVILFLFNVFNAYSQEPLLPKSATYYQMDLNSYDDFLNGVWTDVYNWDPSRDYLDKKSGLVPGGWKALVWDNLYLEHYTEYGGYWEGWCPSNRDFVYEEVNPLNQFTATTKGGKDGIGTPYFIGYYGWGTDRGNACYLRMNDGVSCIVAGMYVTNLHYTYQSIFNGDGFARKFVQGDWFMLTAYGYDANNNVTGSVDFYLADYRSANPSEWHVVGDWQWFDLSSLGEVLMVEFVLSSTDNTVYGMNTPSYFCMDKLTLSLISIQEQPLSQRACLGDSVAFTAKVIGNDYYNTRRKGKPQIQWRKNGVDIAGATDTILVLKNVTFADSGSYTCYALSDYETDLYKKILKDSTFKAEALSAPAYLQVSTPVSLTQQPADTSIVENKTALFTVHCTVNENVRYQWFKNNVALAGQTNDTLMLSPALPANTGRYYCVATSVCNSEASQQAILTIIPLPKPAEETSLVSLCEGSILHIAVGQSDTQHHYTWYKNGELLDGNTQPFIHRTSLQSADSGEYACNIANDTMTQYIKRYEVSIIPVTRFLAPIQSENGQGRTLLRASVNGAELQYNWYKNNQRISITDTSSLWVNQKGNYYCQVSGLCGEATSATTSITITDIPGPDDERPYLSANHCKAGGIIALNNADGYKIRLMNLNGIIVMETECTDEHVQLPMSYPQGVYVLQALPSKKASRQYHNPVWKLVVE